jgi:hypothetical protein
MALKMIQGVGRFQLLNPETAANVKWLQNDSKIGRHMTIR